MVKLIGEFGEEAQEALRDLHRGIDAGKSIVTAVHDFEIKLSAVDIVIGHIEFNYSHYEGLYAFFTELSDMIVELRDELEQLEKGEIHFVLEEEAAKKKSTQWILMHRKAIEEVIKEEKEVDKQIIRKIHRAFVKLRKLFIKSEHLFSLYIRKTEIKKFKLKLEEDEEQVKHILEQLMRFIFAYEKIFKRAL